MDLYNWLEIESDSEKLDPTFPEKFSSVFSEELRDGVKSLFKEIGQSWVEMGLPVSFRDQKIDNMRTSLLEMVTKFVQSERKFLIECQNYGNFKLDEVNKILRDLSLEKFTLPTNQTLIERNKILQAKYNELLEIRNERFEKLGLITSKLQRKSHLLGIEYKDPILSNIPTEFELKTLASKLSELEKTLSERRKEFDCYHSIITKLSHELEYFTTDLNEQNILAANKDSYIFSDCNMAYLNRFHQKIINVYNDFEKNLKQLKETLNQLFNRLEVSDEERSQFYKSLIGSLPNQRRLLENEISKYEIIKKNSLATIIKSVRAEIYKLMHKFQTATSVLGSTEDSSESLNSEIDDSDNTEEVLDQLEAELKHLVSFDNNYEEVFDKLVEWKKCLEDLLELEKKSRDPNRLNNRGGTLLQDEKLRKMLNLKLPKLEKKILLMVSKVGAESKIPFDKYCRDIGLFFQENLAFFNEAKDGSKSTNAQGSKKSAPESAQKYRPISTQKTRIGISPRIPALSNGPRNMLKRNLDSALKQTELDLFQKGINHNELLHSTLLTNVENKMPASNIPSSYGLSGSKRRRSRSLNELIRPKTNKITRPGSPIPISRRPPFH